MIRVGTIIAFILFIGFLLNCKRSTEPQYHLSTKAENFRIYTNALDQCKKLPVDSLLQCTQDIINIDTIKDIRHNIWSTYGRAKALFHNNRGVEAIDVINRILPETESHDLLFERAELLQLRSHLFAVSFKRQLAAEDSYQAADIYMQLGLKHNASSSYLRIANLQYNTANYRLAIENGIHTVKLLQDISPREHNDSIQLMNVYNTLGLAYYKLNQLDSAEKYYDLSFDMAARLKDEFWKGLVTGNRADIYVAKGMLDKAIEGYRHDVNTSLTHDDPTSAAISLVSIGEVYVSDRQLDIGRHYYDSAYALLSKSGRPISLSNYYRLMSQWYDVKGDYDSAFMYYKKHIEFRDSVQSIRINSQLQQMQNQKQFEKQLADINLLKTENELREKELWISRISIFAFILVSALLFGLLYTVKRNYKKLNQLNQNLESKVRSRTDKLRKINKELDTYLYRASHDVRRPILTILGLIQVADITNENERHKIREVIKKTAYGMDKMLRKLQMAYELEKESNSKYTIIDINNFICEKITELNKEYPCATFEIIKKDEVFIKSNLSLVDIIFTNILENACIFSLNGQNHTKITLSQPSRFVNIVIRDNGIGIDPAFIGRIFDAYTRFNNRSTGSGLGLHLARKAVKKIGGDIKVKSALDQGAEFLITIPIR